jgi:hypothetical protein
MTLLHTSNARTAGSLMTEPKSNVQIAAHRTNSCVCLGGKVLSYHLSAHLACSLIPVSLTLKSLLFCSGLLLKELESDNRKKWMGSLSCGRWRRVFLLHLRFPLAYNNCRTDDQDYDNNCTDDNDSDSAWRRVRVRRCGCGRVNG